MNTQTVLMLCLGMLAVTYVSRRAFLKMPEHLFSDRLKNGLTFIPVGIFAGLIFPSVFVKEEALTFDPYAVAACVICIALMKLSKNVFLSFGISLLFMVIVTVSLH